MLDSEVESNTFALFCTGNLPIGETVRVRVGYQKFEIKVKAESDFNRVLTDVVFKFARMCDVIISSFECLIKLLYFFVAGTMVYNC